jgi:hypothetical protein
MSKRELVLSIALLTVVMLFIRAIFTPSPMPWPYTIICFLMGIVGVFAGELFGLFK